METQNKTDKTSIYILFKTITKEYICFSYLVYHNKTLIKRKISVTYSMFLP